MSEMRNGHGKAERHAGLPDRGDPADKGPALDGRECARDHHGAMLDDRKREAGAWTEPVGKKIERNIAAARRYPSITSQIIMNTSTSSAPVNTIPNR